MPVLPIAADDGLVLPAADARAIGESLSSEYCFADPFPHIVLDDFLPRSVAELAAAHFPAERLASDHVFELGYAGLHKRQVMPDECDGVARMLFQFFNSRPFVEFLEGLTAIPGLIPDPYYVGGGFHETTRGGKLGIHADFRLNQQLALHRRVNVIIYLNERWEDAWRGHLELWSRDMKECRKAVAPIFNRSIIFNTDATSYHGHPDPLETPEGVSRRSIALYYYTASRAIFEEVPTRSSMYQARPGDDAETRREVRVLQAEQHLSQWLPPILLRGFGALRRRLRT